MNSKFEVVISNSQFTISISSYLGYSQRHAVIYFENQFVAAINQYHGLENLEIEMRVPLYKKFWEFKLSEFEVVLQFVKETLWIMQKLPDEYV